MLVALGLLTMAGVPDASAQMRPLRPRICTDLAEPAARPEEWLADAMVRRGPLHPDVDHDPARWRAQVVVAEEAVEPDGIPCVHWYGWREGAEYTYPASAIKTFGGVAALLTLREHGPFGWTPETPLRIGTVEVPPPTGPATVGHGRTTTLRQLLADALVESSNPGFNALYDIAGMEGLHRLLFREGLPTVRLYHRLSMGAVDPEAHRWAPRVEARVGGAWVEVLPARVAGADTLPAQDLPRIDVGSAWIDDRTGQRVEAPMDFRRRNGVGARDLMALIQAVARPGLFDTPAPLGLLEPDRALLRELLTGPLTARGGVSAPDRESRFKPLLPGMLRAGYPREALVYTNKAGRAYGFHLDCARVEHAPTGRAFTVFATVHADRDGTLNDDRYDHSGLSFPWLQAVGELLVRELWGPP
jgi:hypothetical protein